MNQPDQADILAANERLTTELAAATRERDEARNRIAALEAQLIQANETRNNATNLLTEANQTVASLTQQLADARSERDGLRAERDTLAAADRDFNKRVSAELVKHGIRAEGVEVLGATGTKKLTLTEECRLANAAKA